MQTKRLIYNCIGVGVIVGLFSIFVALAVWVRSVIEWTVSTFGLEWTAKLAILLLIFDGLAVGFWRAARGIWISTRLDKSENLKGVGE